MFGSISGVRYPGVFAPVGLGCGGLHAGVTGCGLGWLSVGLPVFGTEAAWSESNNKTQKLKVRAELLLVLSWMTLVVVARWTSSTWQLFPKSTC